MDTNSMNIQEIAKAERTEALIAQLIRIWKDSVRASHHFLTEDDICHLTPQAEGALRFIDTLLIAYETENPVGFMGIQAQKIEMLFLSPACFGQGLGKRLVRLAFDKWDVRYVDVNEQNEGPEDSTSAWASKYSSGTNWIAKGIRFLFWKWNFSL